MLTKLLKDWVIQILAVSATGHSSKHCQMERKFPCIPPLFHGDKFIVDFQEKSEIFNSFFGDQCSPISNRSVLNSELPLRTDSSLSSCHFTKDDIL